MASAIPNTAKGRLVDGTKPWAVATDIRAMLLMIDTTADTEVDAINDLADYTTLGEGDATGAADVALASEAVNIDDANDRAELDADNISFSSLGGDATSNYQGVLLFFYVDGTNANDLPCAFIEFTNQPLSSGATQIDVPWDAEGILQLS